MYPQQWLYHLPGPRLWVLEISHWSIPCTLWNAKRSNQWTFTHTLPPICNAEFWPQQLEHIWEMWTNTKPAAWTTYFCIVKCSNGSLAKLYQFELRSSKMGTVKCSNLQLLWWKIGMINFYQPIYTNKMYSRPLSVSLFIYLFKNLSSSNLVGKKTKKVHLQRNYIIELLVEWVRLGSNA